MTRFSLVLGVPAESGTCVQRAVSESPANQSASPVAVESRFGDSLVEVEWAWPKARASVSTSSGRSRASESETIVLRVDTIVSDSRSEEHTSELQSPCKLVCSLSLERKDEL